jgi:hypothetical protein
MVPTEREQTMAHLPQGMLRPVTKRTTTRNYEDDLLTARALFDERTHFAYSNHEDPEVNEQTWKVINDALNNEWQRGITIEAWVKRAIDASR